MQLPVTVLNANTKRDQGKKAQLGNITAAKVLERGVFQRVPHRKRAPWPHASSPCSLLRYTGGSRHHSHDAGPKIYAQDVA